jgi:hypothetical protein
MGYWIGLVALGVLGACSVIYAAVVFELRRRHGINRGLLGPDDGSSQRDHAPARPGPAHVVADPPHKVGLWLVLALTLSMGCTAEVYRAVPSPGATPQEIRRVEAYCSRYSDPEPCYLAAGYILEPTDGAGELVDDVLGRSSRSLRPSCS